jgi:hypothetical protein
MVLASITAAVAAYVVQASFDVQQIGLSFCFWLLVGLVGPPSGHHGRGAYGTDLVRLARAGRGIPGTEAAAIVALREAYAYDPRDLMIAADLRAATAKP